jgi:hypothetical protein
MDGWKDGGMEGIEGLRDRGMDRWREGWRNV